MLNIQDYPFFSKNTSLIIKGIAAVFIMMSHIIVDCPFWVKKLFPGNLWVSVFFFYSAYGLIFSVKNKNQYIDGFLRRKFFQIYLPFFVAESSYTLLILLKSGQMNPVDTILGCLGLKLSNGSLWYVIEIIAIYLLFYVWVRFFQLKHKWLWIVSYVIFVILSVAFDIGTCWYISTGVFLLGLFLEDIIIWISKLKFPHFLFCKLIPLIFILMYLSNIWIEYNNVAICGIKPTYIQTFLDMVLSLLFIPLLISVSRIMTRTPRVLINLGKISYEIYLWHIFVFTVVISIFSHPTINIVLTVFVALALSSIMFSIKCRLLEAINQK